MKYSLIKTSGEESATFKPNRSTGEYFSKKLTSWNANYFELSTRNCPPVTCTYAKFCGHCVYASCYIHWKYNPSVTLCGPINPEILTIF